MNNKIIEEKEKIMRDWKREFEGKFVADDILDCIPLANWEEMKDEVFGFIEAEKEKGYKQGEQEGLREGYEEGYEEALEVVNENPGHWDTTDEVLNELDKLERGKQWKD